MKPRLLAVDDEVAVLEMLGTMLRAEGAQVTECRSPQEGLERLKGHCFDGAFVDFNMPSMNGLEFVRRARESDLNRRIPLVLTTALHHSELMREGLRAGANFFLAKPIVEERLQNLVQVIQGTMQREKVRYLRVPFRSIVHGESTDGEKLRLISVNLAETGILVQTIRRLELGQRLHLELNLPGNLEPIHLPAHVVRQQGNDQVALHFDDAREGDIELIRRFMIGSWRV